MKVNTNLLLGLVSPLLAAAQTQVDNRTIDEIYEAAQQETGPLRAVLGGSSYSAGTGIRNAWKARFPNVELNLTTDASKYVDSRIDRAWLDGEVYTDVAFLETVQDYPRWKREGRLLNYMPPNWDDLNNQFRDDNGAYFCAQIYQFGPFWYDSTRVPAERVPTNYMDILDPYWKGKMVLEYPNDDDGSLYLFHLIIQRYGYSWLDRLMEQDVLWVRGAAGPAYTIIQGANSTANSSRVLTFTTLGNYGSSTFKRAAPEAPEQFMSWAQTSAIFANTTRPESAKLFQAFLLSDEWQQKVVASSPSVRNSLISDPAQNIFMQNNTQVSGYNDYMSDRAVVERFRFQLEMTIGLVTGPNPIDIYTFP